MMDSMQAKVNMFSREIKMSEMKKHRNWDDTVSLVSQVHLRQWRTKSMNLDIH